MARFLEPIGEARNQIECVSGYTNRGGEILVIGPFELKMPKQIANQWFKTDSPSQPFPQFPTVYLNNNPPTRYTERPDTPMGAGTRDDGPSPVPKSSPSSGDRQSSSLNTRYKHKIKKTLLRECLMRNSPNSIKTDS